MKRLFIAAREKKLDRVAAGYLVVAWLVIQAASIALPVFGAPGWAMKLLLGLAVIGLPLALLASWLWLMDDVSGVADPEAKRPLWRRADFIVLIVIVVVVMAGLVELAWTMWPRSVREAAANGPSSASQASIAVLPFANLSGDNSKQYFSDGISEQLIGELAKMPKVRVAARTSSFAFKGKDTNIKAIARALNVKTVVEGSVREAGNRVRISAELINASDGFQIWSSSYDRDLTDILSLQDEIARSITKALTSHLLGKTEVIVVTRKPGIDPEAYTAYLQGKFYLSQRTEETLDRATTLFERVTALAPDYAPGYAELGYTHIIYAFNAGRMEHVAPAQAAIEKALSLDPNNLEALCARINLYLLQWNWDAAGADVEKLQRTNPGAALTWHTSSLFYVSMGLPERGFAAEKKAIMLDPLSFAERLNLTIGYVATSHDKEAAEQARAALAIQPGNIEALANLCTASAGQGDLKTAANIRAQIAASIVPSQQLPLAQCDFYIDYYKKDFVKARQILDKAVASDWRGSGISASDIATGYRILGDNDTALKWYRKALGSHDMTLLAEETHTRGSTTLFADPRWAALKRSVDTKNWEAARVRLIAQGVGG